MLGELFLGISMFLFYQILSFFFVRSQQCANWVHGNRRASRKTPNFLTIFWGLRSAHSITIPRRGPLNLIKSPIFTNPPGKSACLYNAPSVHIVEGVVPANRTQESEVRELFRKKFGFGSGTPSYGVLFSSRTSSEVLPQKFANLTFFDLVCQNHS